MVAMLIRLPSLISLPLDLLTRDTRSFRPVDTAPSTINELPDALETVSLLPPIITEVKLSFGKDASPL